MTLNFKEENDEIYIIGTQRNDINSSEYLHKICGVEFSPSPYFNLDEEHYIQKSVSKMISHQLISSAHDVSEGGLFVTLMECCFQNNLGFNINNLNTQIRQDAFWFGEAQSRIVVSVNKNNRQDFVQLLEKLEPLETTFLGNVTSGEIILDGNTWGNIIDWKNKYDHAIELLISKNK